MEMLFDGNMIALFMFFLINILGYSEIKLVEQRICIAYIIIFMMRAFDMIGTIFAIVLGLISIMMYIEILTDDKMKLKFLKNVKYLILDYVYQSIFTFHIIEVSISLFFYQIAWDSNLLKIKSASFILAIWLSIRSIHSVLNEDVEYATFTEMYKKTMLYPLNEFKNNKKFYEVCRILVYIQDREYYLRNGYTVFSKSSVINILRRKKQETHYKVSTVKILSSMFKSLIFNLKAHARGYSTIGSQLFRTLAIKNGYENTWKRKIYEMVYTYIFFNCLFEYEEKYRVANVECFKDWIVYLYFHYVNTFLGKEDIQFSNILEAFDKTNEKDIYDISNEGVLIACLGINKKTKYITEENLKNFIPNIRGVKFDVNKLTEMIKHLDEPYYDGQYLI